MVRIQGLAVLALAACGGGGGLSFEEVTLLPRTQSYVLGFEPDGAPLFGQADPVRLLRYDGAEWAAHAVARPFIVAGFSSDRDGTPLVVHRVDPGFATEVWRLEPGGAAVQLGSSVPDRASQVMQNVSGTRFLFGGGATWVLRSGSTAWEPYPITLRDPSRAPDGRIYAISSGAVLRIEDDDSTVLRSSCEQTLTSCSGTQFQVDLAGRLYLRAGANLHIFDPASGLIEEVVLPDLAVSHVAVTES